MGFENNEKLVSICTPCYNHKRYLEDYFESIINQQYQNIELIIIDDCSNDNSAEIIKDNMPRLKQRFTRVVFERNKENLGINKTANLLLKETRGEYVKFVASDDLLLNDSIQKLVDYMEEHTDRLLVIGNACIVSDQYKYGELYPERKIMNIQAISQIDNLYEKLLMGNFIASVGMFCRQDTFEKYGYFDPDLLYEDWDYLLRISRNERIYFFDEIVYLYRESDTSYGSYMRCTDKAVMEMKFIRMYIGGLQILEKNTKYLDLDDVNRVIKNHMVIFLNKAAEYKLIECEKRILLELKQRNLKLSFQEKICYIWTKYLKKYYYVVARIKNKFFPNLKVHKC